MARKVVPQSVLDARPAQLLKGRPVSTKTVIQQRKVFLQYPADGEPGPRGLRVSASDANRWVSVADGFATEAYSVPIPHAQNFGTRKDAEEFNSLVGNVFLVREVTVTYEF